MRATTIFVAVAKLALAASVAQAQGLAWRQRPSEAEIQTAYPPAAKAAGLAGYAFLACRVDREGVFRSCDVSGEAPEGHGFGKAALGLASYMRAAARDSGPPLIDVTIPVAFGTSVDRPVRDKSFKTSDGRFSTTSGRFKALAPIGPYWPDMALRTGLSGHAAIDCKVEVNGALADCTMVGSHTTHPSFGYAMLAMARRGWMTAGPPPAETTPPADGVWRFELDFPRRTLNDVR